MIEGKPMSAATAFIILIALTAGSTFYEIVIADDASYKTILSVAIYQSVALFCAWASGKLKI